MSATAIRGLYPRERVDELTQGRNFGIEFFVAYASLVLLKERDEMFRDFSVQDPMGGGKLVVVPGRLSPPFLPPFKWGQRFL
jgi:hypothetical protein